MLILGLLLSTALQVLSWIQHQPKRSNSNGRGWLQLYNPDQLAPRNGQAKPITRGRPRN